MVRPPNLRLDALGRDARVQRMCENSDAANFCQGLPHPLDLQALLPHDLQQTVVFAFQAPEQASVIIRAVRPKKAFGFSDTRVPGVFLPEGDGPASEIAPELLEGPLALLSLLEEDNELLFGGCACIHRSSSLSGAHEGSPCAPPGNIRMTLISVVHFQGGSSPQTVGKYDAGSSTAASRYRPRVLMPPGGGEVVILCRLYFPPIPDTVRAIKKAAPEATAPTSMVWKALRMIGTPVKRPLIAPKANRAIRVRMTERSSA